MDFEYDKILNLEKEINSLSHELKPNQKCNENYDDASDNDIHLMKKQIIELLVDKEKLTKKCGDLVYDSSHLNFKNPNTFHTESRNERIEGEK